MMKRALAINRLVDIYYLPTYLTLNPEGFIGSINSLESCPDLESSILSKYFIESNCPKDIVEYNESGSASVSFNGLIYSTSKFTENHVDPTYYYFDLPKNIFSEGTISYDDCLHLIDKYGLIEAAEVIRCYRYYSISTSDPFTIVPDRDPIEFYLHSMGLQRIDSVNYEHNKFNTEPWTESEERFSNIQLVSL